MFPFQPSIDNQKQNLKRSPAPPLPQNDDVIYEQQAEYKCFLYQQKILIIIASAYKPCFQLSSTNPPYQLSIYHTWAFQNMTHVNQL